MRIEATKYRDYLQSPEWQVVRRLALYAADHRCQLCYGKGVLDVHHRTYNRLGYERPSDVTVLCRECHQKFHGIDQAVATTTDFHRYSVCAVLGPLDGWEPWEEGS